MANSTLPRVKKTILIAPSSPSPLAAALADEARTAGWRVVLVRTVLAQGEASQAGASGPALAHPEDPDFLELPVNPSSYVSVAALLLSVRNAFGDPDAAVLVQDPSAFRLDLLGGSAGEVETSLHREALGPALLAREVLRGFSGRGSGSILLACVEAEGGPLGPAASLVAAAFQGLGDGIFAAAKESAWEALGVLDKGSNPQETARFCIRLLGESKGGRSGRWLKFTGKPGLFGVF